VDVFGATESDMVTILAFAKRPLDAARVNDRERIPRSRVYFGDAGMTRDALARGCAPFVRMMRALARG
jgi:hypothetical protein